MALWQQILSHFGSAHGPYPTLQLTSHKKRRWTVYLLYTVSTWSLSFTIIWNWIISYIRCVLSVSWFTLWTIFGGSVIYALHCPCHGSPYKPYLANQYSTLWFFCDFVELVWHFNRYSFLSVFGIKASPYKIFH